MAEKGPAEIVIPETEELPMAIVRRLVKEKLSSLSMEGNISVQREAYFVFSKSARIFIHYLTATAFDICRESKRQTINAEDVFKALEDIEFTDFIEPLRASLEEFRQQNASKRSKSTKEKEASNNKRKVMSVETREVEKEKEENNKEEVEEEETNKKRKVLPVEDEEEEEEVEDEEEEVEDDEEVGKEEEKGSVEASDKTDDDDDEDDD